MTDDDRRRWDVRHVGASPLPAPPAAFSRHADRFPTAGRALDVACGSGAASVWLARRGLDVVGLDVSGVAVDQARDLDDTGRCRFEQVDLDDGLPPGPPVDVLLCHRFRDPRLYDAMRARLAPGGLLAVAVLSEVGAEPGPFRAPPGELTAAFADVDVLDHGEADGLAWLLARSPS